MLPALPLSELSFYKIPLFLPGFLNWSLLLFVELDPIAAGQSQNFRRVYNSHPSVVLEVQFRINPSRPMRRRRYGRNLACASNDSYQ